MTSSEPTPGFDLSSLAAIDQAEFRIKHPVTGEATGWTWTIAGPGHAQTLARSDLVQRRALAEQRARDQARTNGKKWHADDRDPDEVRREAAENVAARVIAFTPAVLDGETVSFSPANAVRLFLDPRYGWIYAQIIEFLVEDASFFPKSPRS